MTQRAIRVIDSRKSPWFGWLHYYDPHEAKRDIDRYHELCLGFDDAFGRLLEHLKKRNLYDNTIIAGVADHGEALGEHNQFCHGGSLYEENVRVPLIIRMPGVAPRVIHEPVTAIDLTATLTAAVGANTSKFDGVNLLAFEKESPEKLNRRPVFTELHRYFSNTGKRTADIRAVRVGATKLIVDRKKETVELFDLSSDPKELHSLADERPDETARLHDLIDAHTAREEKRHTLP